MIPTKYTTPFGFCTLSDENPPQKDSKWETFVRFGSRAWPAHTSRETGDAGLSSICDTLLDFRVRQVYDADVGELSPTLRRSFTFLERREFWGGGVDGGHGGPSRRPTNGAL